MKADCSQGTISANLSKNKVFGRRYPDGKSQWWRDEDCPTCLGPSRWRAQMGAYLTFLMYLLFFASLLPCEPQSYERPYSFTAPVIDET
jgi:hypothetical protein